MMTLSGVDFQTLVSEPNPLTTRPSPCALVVYWVVSQATLFLLLKYMHHKEGSCTRYQKYIIPNGHYPEWTPSRMTLSRMDTIPNGHDLE